MAISKITLNGVTQMDLTQDSVDSTNTLYGETGHKNDGTAFTGGVASVTQATPTISVNSSTGLITATSTQSAGVVAAGTKTATEQLSVQAAATITPSTSQQTAVAAGKYTTGAVVVSAMPTMTLPTAAAASATSGFTQKATISRSTSNQYINIPTGYNSAGGYYLISATPNGTEGTPTATKGTVSNHSISVTPSVTNSAGYISGGTKTGTAVTVSASELVSGSETKTSNGTYDVTNLETLVVNVASGGANFGTVTMTNSNNQAQSIDFTLPSGRTPKAFFARLTAQISRNSGSRYYYVENMRWDGSTTGGVAGRCFYMYSGQLTNITSGYSYSQSGTTFTLSSTGSRSASPGSFYNGQYELVYVY